MGGMSPAVLAEFAPLSPSAQWAIVSILGVISTIAVIWGVIRRRPPVGEDLVQLRTSIDALKGSVEQLTEAHEKHVTHAAEIETLKREVGELREHRENDLRAQRTYTRESTERIFLRIEQLNDSVNKNFQAVERAIGKLEGKVEANTPP
jgi:Na+/phosphate symporter